MLQNYFLYFLNIDYAIVLILAIIGGFTLDTEEEIIMKPLDFIFCCQVDNLLLIF